MPKKKSFTESLRFEEAWGSYHGDWPLGGKTVPLIISPGDDPTFVEQSETYLEQLTQNWELAWKRIVAQSQRYLRELEWLKKRETLPEDSLEIFSLGIEDGYGDPYFSRGILAHGILREEDFLDISGDFNGKIDSVSLGSLI